MANNLELPIFLRSETADYFFTRIFLFFLNQETELKKNVTWILEGVKNKNFDQHFFRMYNTFLRGVSLIACCLGPGPPHLLRPGRHTRSIQGRIQMLWGLRIIFLSQYHFHSKNPSDLCCSAQSQEFVYK